MAHKDLKCMHCKSFNVSSYQARQRKHEKYMEEVGLQGKGATRCGSYRIPLRQDFPHPVSSKDESGRGTPDRPDPPVSISNTMQIGLQVKLALRRSQTRESEPPVLPSHPDGQTAQPPPSPPNGSLSSLLGKVGASPTPPQVTQDLPDIASLEVGSGQGEDGAGSEPGEVCEPCSYEGPSFPPEECRSGSYQSPSEVVHPNPILNEFSGVEHTLHYGEELAGSTQAQLLLSSGLIPPHGGLATPAETDTPPVSFGGPFRALRAFPHPLTPKLGSLL